MKNMLDLSLEMTDLERQFKEILSQRPDVRDHILTSEEISDYIAWMAKTFGDAASLSPSQLPVQPCSPKLASIADRLLANPMDNAAFSQLSSGYGNQSEEFFITADHDIAVSRQLRYMPSHWHSNGYFEIYYTVSGNCPIHFPDEVVETRPGTVVVVSPGAIHATPCYGDDCVLLYYMLRTSTFQQVFWNQLPAQSLMAQFFRQALDGDHPTSYLHFETANDPEIRRLLLQIYEEDSNQDLYKIQMLNSLMSTFFILLLRRFEGIVRLPRTKDFYWKHQYSGILSHIQTNYATVTLQELADKYHYSQRQVSRIVQSCMGMSYNQLILKLRMEKAVSLLNQKVHSIDAISQMVGYTTKSSFYRAFTGYYGCTPKEYLER